MNKLICSLIMAIGFGSLPVANAAESVASSVTSGHATAHRVTARKHRHHHHGPVAHHKRHHGHHHHKK